jgi:hypothetical protein
MPEDRNAVRAHVRLVRERLYPEIQIDRFGDAKRLIARFERIVSDWGARRSPDASAIIEAANEICVAIQLLKLQFTAHFLMVYEPRITVSGQSIDFLLTYAEERHYFDVKTIRPRDLQDTKRAWEKYGELRQLFPTNADLLLAKNWMGGDFWHFFSSARAKFLDYALSLERKIAGLSKCEGQTVRMVFCGDRVRWRKDQLEDFADFYRTGLFRQDDPFRQLQAHYLTQKRLVIERTIDGFCYMERLPLDPSGDRFRDRPPRPRPGTVSRAPQPRLSASPGHQDR